MMEKKTTEKVRIEQYIKSAKHLLSGEIPLSVEDVALFEDFKNISKYYLKNPLEVFTVYSSDIFPQIIHSNSYNHLLWEKKFWEIYQIYLVGVGYFAQTDIVHENDINNMITNVIIEFLMYSLENSPGISFALANDLLNINNREEIVHSINNAVDIRFVTDIRHIDYKSILMQSQYYVFYHELMHVNYKEHPKWYEEMFDIIKLLAEKSLSENIRLYCDDGDEEINKLFKQALISIVRGTDLSLIEEIVCDFHVFNILVINMSDIYNDNKLKIISDIQETMRICSFFQCELRYINDIWMEYIDFYKFYNQKPDLLFDECHVVNNLQAKIDRDKNRAFIRDAVLFQLTQLFCILKYKTYSPLNDILSDIKVRDKLFTLFTPFLNNEYILKKIAIGIGLQENTKLNSKQIIEARDMLYDLKTAEVIFT